MVGAISRVNAFTTLALMVCAKIRELRAHLQISPKTSNQNTEGEVLSSFPLQHSSTDVDRPIAVLWLLLRLQEEGGTSENKYRHANDDGNDPW
mmetsp:Transcript_30765/g.74316  ORF Transcript_30765/g.74316 Transcript_30765/m.74316 type:complete len:93 (+) Transcript_30765:502-780(+)